MKKIRQAYYYLFYRFYLFAETKPFVDDNSDWTATGFIAILETFIYFSGVIFYKFFFNRTYYMSDDSLIFILPISVIGVINYVAFLRNDAWVTYYEKFENWPAERNRKAGMVVLCLVLAILLCFAVAIYLVTRMNK